VCIFALTENNTVVMAKQFRPGPGKVMHELPGGIIDEGESPETAAARELLEETGYQAEDIKLVITYYPDAYYMGKRNICIGRNAKKISEQKLDHNEFIEAVEVSIEEFKKILESGELTDYAGGVAGLHYTGLL
jgi:ADP-ribose pyrophosphatase